METPKIDSVTQLFHELKTATGVCIELNMRHGYWVTEDSVRDEVKIQVSAMAIFCKGLQTL